MSTIQSNSTYIRMRVYKTQKTHIAYAYVYIFCGFSSNPTCSIIKKRRMFSYPAAFFASSMDIAWEPALCNAPLLRAEHAEKTRERATMHRPGTRAHARAAAMLLSTGRGLMHWSPCLYNTTVYLSHRHLITTNGTIKHTKVSLVCFPRFPIFPLESPRFNKWMSCHLQGGGIHSSSHTSYIFVQALGRRRFLYL